MRGRILADAALAARGFNLTKYIRSESPDLLITGDAMRGLQGSEIALRLHERGDRFPVIVTAAWEPTRAAGDAMAA
jgi:DNA-binding NtrC family response regulator